MSTAEVGGTNFPADREGIYGAWPGRPDEVPPLGAYELAPDPRFDNPETGEALADQFTSALDRLVAAGATSYDICELLDVSVITAERWIWRMALPTPDVMRAAIDKFEGLRAQIVHSKIADLSPEELYTTD